MPAEGAPVIKGEGGRAMMAKSCPQAAKKATEVNADWEATEQVVEEEI